METVYFAGPVAHLLLMPRGLMKILSPASEKEEEEEEKRKEKKKAYGYHISHFYWSFLSDVMASTG